MSLSPLKLFIAASSILTVASTAQAQESEKQATSCEKPVTFLDNVIYDYGTKKFQAHFQHCSVEKLPFKMSTKDGSDIVVGETTTTLSYDFTVAQKDLDNVAASAKKKFGDNVGIDKEISHAKKVVSCMNESPTNLCVLTR